MTTSAIQLVTPLRLDPVVLAVQSMLHTRQVRLAAQPVLRYGRTQADWVEILMRAHTPDGQSIPADRIFETAHAHGLAGALDDLILDVSLNWLSRNPALRLCSVNVSTQSLCRAGLADRVLTACATAQVRPDRVCLEITESAPLSDLDTAIGELAELRASGVKIALDDFGAGHNHLRLASRGLVDILKIDRQLIVLACASDPGGPADQVLVALISMGQQLGLEVVVEGVETETERALAGMIQGLGVQGYHVATPRLLDDEQVLTVNLAGPQLGRSLASPPAPAPTPDRVAASYDPDAEFLDWSVSLAQEEPTA